MPNVVTLRDMMQVFPYDDSFTRFTITGQQLRKIFAHFMQPENRTGEGEFYQVNSSVRAIYKNTSHQLESLDIHGEPVDDVGQYTIGLVGYHIKNSNANLNISIEELTALKGPKVTTTSLHSVIEEYLRGHQNLTRQVEGRLVYR